MKIILGLGNPGEEYAATRHNAGIRLVNEMFKVQCSISNENDCTWVQKRSMWVAETANLVLVKSAEVFMNQSDEIINDLRYLDYDLRDLYLAHDDLDIKLGEAKIHLGKGPKVHNGVNAVEAAMGTKEFWRIRIGIENRTTPIEGETYVLQKFTDEENTVLEETLGRIINEVL